MGASNQTSKKAGRWVIFIYAEVSTLQMYIDSPDFCDPDSIVAESCFVFFLNIVIKNYLNCHDLTRVAEYVFF